MADSAGPEKKSVPKRQPPTHPKWYDMVLEAVGDTTDSKGASVQAIKTYIVGKYPTVDQSTMKYCIRRALDKGLELKVLKRPKASEEATGLTGRFKLDKVVIKAESKAKAKPAKPTKPKKVAESVEKTPPKAKKTSKTSKTDKAATVKTTKSKTVAKKQLNLGTPKATKPKPKKAEMKTPKKTKSALKSKSAAKKTSTPTVKATKKKTTPKKTTPKKSKGKTTKSKS